jgi:hypothetical protein
MSYPDALAHMRVLAAIEKENTAEGFFAAQACGASARGLCNRYLL